MKVSIITETIDAWDLFFRQRPAKGSISSQAIKCFSVKKLIEQKEKKKMEINSLDF